MKNNSSLRCLLLIANTTVQQNLLVEVNISRIISLQYKDVNISRIILDLTSKIKHSLTILAGKFKKT